MKKINVFLLTIFSLVTLFSCEEYDSSVKTPDFLTFGKNAENIEFVTESPVSSITVYASNVSNSDRTVNIVELSGNDSANQPFTTALDGDYVLESTSVIIPAGEMSATVNISFDPNLSLAANRYVTFEAQSADEDSFFNVTTTRIKVNFKRMCFSNTIIHTLVLDRYGSETTWNIKNSSGVVVQSGGPYSDAPSNVLQPQTPMTFTLPDGTYTYTINDAYGDGLFTSATVSGTYNVSKDCGSVLVSGGGNFGVIKTHTFTLP